MSDITQAGTRVPFYLKRTVKRDAEALELHGFTEAGAAPQADPMRALADWVREFLMRPHADLGRPGHVCPFTAQAARLGTIRIGLSSETGNDPVAILDTMMAALRAFEAIPCQPAMRQFRTVIVGFPGSGDAKGIAALKRVQRALRHRSILGAKMIGLFEPNSPDTGLINPEFRPLRAPVPALAIRMLVEGDAPFVVRNPLLAPIYLIKFPLAGTRRLLRLLRDRRH